MKIPKISFRKEDAVGFFLNHGEKIVVAMVGMLACGLVWGGIDSIRQRPAGRDQQPAVIVERAATTSRHIEEAKNPPAETTPKPSLTTLIEPWRSNRLAVRDDLPQLNRPLFEEKSKRSQPEVFPVEDLHAVAGYALLAVLEDRFAAGTNPVAGRDAEADVQPPPTGRRQGRVPPRAGARGATPPGNQPTSNAGIGGDEASMNTQPPLPFGAGLAAGGNPQGSSDATLQGKIMPYCIVTGLIPMVKQSEEFSQRYANAGYRDQVRDQPMWSNFRVERAVVDPSKPANDEALSWENIDLRGVVKRAKKDWAGVQQESLPQDFLLGQNQQPQPDPNPANMVFPYCSPIPELAGRVWGPEAIHPWFVKTLRDRFEAAAEAAAIAEAAAAEARAPGLNFGGAGQGAGPGFQTPATTPYGAPPAPGANYGSPQGPSANYGAGGDEASESGGFQPMSPPGLGATQLPPGVQWQPGMPPPPGWTIGPDGRPVKPLEYRMFRFVDTSVEAGKVYRYRARISVWNPNFNLPAQYLADETLGKEQKIPSAYSQPTAAVRVPDPNTLLIRTIRKTEAKRVKSGYEVMVLGENPTTGNYALRSVITDLGGFANVDKRLNKTGEMRTRGDDVVTNCVLLDVRGRQEERPEPVKANAPVVPQEPLDMLFIRPDGSFEMAGSAGSQFMVDRYLPTLPPSPEDLKNNPGRFGPGAGQTPFQPGPQGGPGGAGGPGGVGAPAAGKGEQP